MEIHIDNIDKNFLFNIELIKKPSLIKKLIKGIDKTYTINNTFFDILNNYVDVDENGNSLYGGLIVRTGLDDYAILYLENACLDEEYIIKVINEYIYDIADHKPGEININKFAISINTFLNVK